MCTELRVSERTLRRWCHHAFGYGPKRLQRILRFQRFLAAARGAPAGAAGLAAEAGYSDQAHLTREARRMAALTPAFILAQLSPQLAVSFTTLAPSRCTILVPGQASRRKEMPVKRFGIMAVNMWILGACAGARSGGDPMQDVQHVSLSISRRPADVYAFASDPRNLPRWAAGLVGSEVRQEGNEWVADAPFGKVRVKFAEKNPYGVLDHDVRLESGVTIHNPMRVVPNGEGSEFIFTLIRQPGMSDQKFAEDKAAVEKDLRTLKELLEREPH